MDEGTFDLKVPAPNGLRRGYSTGSCATAAAKAALRYLIFEDANLDIEIFLPSMQKLSLRANYVRRTASGALAQITKDSGDDPDITNRCLVEVEVRKNESGLIRFFAGSGVGTVTEDGLQIPKGQPAINPVPRKMIEDNLKVIFNAVNCPDIWKNVGVDVIISIQDGDRLALKTFNPRVGVQGGLSILGTTGIVEPMSLSAWKASIETYIDVALATQAGTIIFSPGRWGQNFFHKEKGVPLNRICMVSNFIGFALDHLSQGMKKSPNQLKTLVFAGHPGKLAKVIDGHWDTHSNQSPTAVASIVAIAEKLFPKELTNELRQSNTVEGVIQICKTHNIADQLFAIIAEKISQAVNNYIGGILPVDVYLADFKGEMIGKFENKIQERNEVLKNVN